MEVNMIQVLTWLQAHSRNEEGDLFVSLLITLAVVVVIGAVIFALGPTIVGLYHTIINKIVSQG
jgi:hypothetical protein